MATVNELAQYLGKEGLYYFDRSAFGVSVRVKNVKDIWGNIQVEITPKDGTGSKWVFLSSVAFHEV